MKKKSLIICFIVFWANSLFAQNDNRFFRNIIVKINPTLIGTGILQDGEYGGIIQFPLIRNARKNVTTYWEDEDGHFHQDKNIDSISHRNIDAFIGGGYNLNSDLSAFSNEPNGVGYTIRGGFYFYQRKHYFSFQFFFRRWNINGIYGIGAYYADTWENDIINPYGTIFDYTDDLNFYQVDNAVVNVYAADVLYGFQFPRHRKPGRLFFECFIGAGIRVKNEELEEVETYDHSTPLPHGTPGTYYPVSTPSYSSAEGVYPDVKLGFMVGIVL
jgi:hypothetical protein